MNKLNLRPNSPHASERGRAYTDLTAGSKVTLGIYVSREKFSVALIKREFTGFTVKSVASSDVPEKFYRDKEVAVEFLTDLLTGLVNPNDDVDIWCTARADKVIISRQLLDCVSDDSLTDLVMWNFRKSSGMNPELYVCDYEVLEDVEDSKSRVAVNIYSLPRQETKYMIDVFKEAGYPLCGLTIPRAGYSNLHYARCFPQFSSFACSIFVGERASSVFIYHDEKVIVSREVKFGFYDLADALVGHFDNEVLQRLDDPEVLKFIDKQLYEVIDKVVHTLDFFYANYRGCDIDCFFIGGLVTDYPLLVKLFEKRLGVELTTLSPLSAENIGVSQKIEESSSSLETAVAVGLCSNKDSINFLFTQVDKMALVRMIKKSRVMKVLFSVAIVILGIVFLNLFEQDSVLQKQLAASENQLKGFKPYKTVGELESKNVRLGSLKVVIEQSTAKATMLQLVNNIAKVLPEEVYVTSLDLEREKNKGKSKNGDKEGSSTKLTLRGAIYGADGELSRRKVGELMLALEGMESFEEVRQSDKKSSPRKGEVVRKGNYFDFSLDMKISDKVSQLL